MELDAATKKYLSDLHQRCEQIEFEAKRDNDGDFSTEQRIEWNATMALIDNIYVKVAPKMDITTGRRTSPNSGAPVSAEFSDALLPDEVANKTSTIEQPMPRRQRWQNLSTGEAVTVYGPRDRMATLGRNVVSLGNYIRGIVTSNWTGAGPEKALALSEGGVGGGHILVPDELSSQWLDLARAQSVMVRAGMPMVEMNSETMTIARLAEDPTFTVTAENEEIDDSDVTFGAVQLVSRKIATIITMSREIAEDAPNAPQIVEQILGRALAVAIDRLCLIGNGGSDGETGLVITPDVGSTGSVAGILWEDFHNAVVGVRENNYNPNAIIVHPTILGDAQILTSGDGTNSAKLWLGPPPSLAGVEFLPTTSITTAYAAAGDFVNGCLMGVRTGMSLETSNVANGAFEKHQVKIKVTQRFAFVVPQPSAFHVLSGITT